MSAFRIRPLAGLCLLHILLILLLAKCGVPLLPEERETAALRSLAEHNRAVYVAGTMAGFHKGDRYDSADLTNVRIGEGKAARKVHGVRIYYSGAFPARMGQEVCLFGTIFLPEAATNPGQFDAASYWRLLRISAFMTSPRVLAVSGKRNAAAEALEGLRAALLARLRAVYTAKEAGVLAAMLLGDRSLYDDETMRRYEAGGVAHMLVISSLHLHLLGMAVCRLCRKMHLPLRVSCALPFGLMLFYVTLTGFRASSVRALASFVLYVLAIRTGRTYDPATALCTAATLLLLANPYCLFYSSFRLSFGAALILLLLRGRGRMAGGLLFQAGMLPLQLYDFFSASVFSLPANLLLVPLLPAVLVTGAAGLVAGGALCVPPVLLLRVYDVLLGAVRALPGAQVVAGRPPLGIIAVYYVLFFALCVLLRMFYDKKKRMFSLLLLIPMAALLFCRPHRGLALTMLDVGQGDAVCVRCEDVRILIDGGSSSVKEVGSRRIEPFFLSEGMGQIDAVFLTHMDEDHINGVREILERIAQGATPLRIGKLILPDLAEDPGAEEGAAVRGAAFHALEKKAELAGVRVLYASEGDTFSAGGAVLTVLAPAKGTGREFTANEASLVLSLSFGKFDALFTGDLEGQGEERLPGTAAKRKGALPSGYEVLKVAHHGSAGSSGEAFLAYARPQAAVISAGRGNPYGHPHADTIERLKAYTTGIFVTAEEGAILVEADKESGDFRVFLPFGRE